LLGLASCFPEQKLDVGVETDLWGWHIHALSWWRRNRWNANCTEGQAPRLGSAC